MATTHHIRLFRTSVPAFFSVLAFLATQVFSRRQSAGCSKQIGDRRFFSDHYRVAHDHRIILQDYPVKCAAKIVSWEVFVPGPGCHLTAEVWRFVRKETVFLSATTSWEEKVYKLLAYTELSTRMSGHIVKFLPPKEQITVERNDVIGLRFSKSEEKKCLLYAEDHSPYPGNRICYLPFRGDPGGQVGCNPLMEHPLNVTFSAKLSFTKATFREVSWESVFPPDIWGTVEPKPRRPRTDNPPVQTSTGLPNLGERDESRRKEKFKGFQRKIISEPTTVSPSKRPGTSAGGRTGVKSMLWLTAAGGMGSAFLVSFIVVLAAFWKRNSSHESRLNFSKPINKAKVVILKAESLACIPKPLAPAGKGHDDVIRREDNHPVKESAAKETAV